MVDPYSLQTLKHSQVVLILESILSHIYLTWKFSNVDFTGDAISIEFLLDSKMFSQFVEI